MTKTAQRIATEPTNPIQPEPFRDPGWYQWHIMMTLTGNRTADFYYSDRNMAEQHYNQLGATMNLGGQAIKTIQLSKWAGFE